LHEGGEVKFPMTAFVKSSDGRDQGAVWNKQDFAWLKLPKKWCYYSKYPVIKFTNLCFFVMCSLNQQKTTTVLHVYVSAPL